MYHPWKDQWNISLIRTMTPPLGKAQTKDATVVDFATQLSTILRSVSSVQCRPIILRDLQHHVTHFTFVFGFDNTRNKVEHFGAHRHCTGRIVENFELNPITWFSKQQRKKNKKTSAIVCDFDRGMRVSFMISGLSTEYQAEKADLNSLCCPYPTSQTI